MGKGLAYKAGGMIMLGFATIAFKMLSPWLCVDETLTTFGELIFEAVDFMDIRDRMKKVCYVDSAVLTVVVRSAIMSGQWLSAMCLLCCMMDRMNVHQDGAQQMQ